MKKTPFILFLVGSLSASLFGGWGQPVPLPLEIRYSFAHLSPDDRQLWYTSGINYDDIFVARWNGSGWDSIVHLGPQINTRNRELSPSITADHRKMYFVAYGRPGGYGSYDVWCSTWDDTLVDWGDPVNCGPNVNTAYGECTAFITGDGRKLYFSSFKDNIIDLDLYVCAWQDTMWGPAISLGPKVNSFTDDFSPWVSADGGKLLFVRWADVYSTDIFQSLWRGAEWDSAQLVGPPISLGNSISDESPSLSSDSLRFIFCSNRPSRDSLKRFWESRWEPGSVVKEDGFIFGGGESGIKVMPNTFTSFTTLPGHSSERFVLYDISGRKVGVYRGDRIGEGLSAGVYFLKPSIPNAKPLRIVKLR